jgi:hypothetical protein
MLIASFGSKWVDAAICKALDLVHGHIVGVVMRKTKARIRNRKATVAYDIAWEHTSLGESSMSSSYLLNGCLVGARLMLVRQQQSLIYPVMKKISLLPVLM